MTEVIGIDHIYISASDMNTSEAFYDSVMSVLGFRKNDFSLGEERHIQYYNKFFGFVLRPARTARAKHDPYSPGLHHFCFRVEGIEELGEIASRLSVLGVSVSGPTHYPQYAPDYYAVFFTDPDGIRLEATNYRAERKERHEKWSELGS